MLFLCNAQSQLSEVLQLALPLPAQSVRQIACLDSSQASEPAKAQPNDCVNAAREGDSEIHSFFTN
jgi:hypothetical protein